MILFVVLPVMTIKTFLTNLHPTGIRLATKRLIISSVGFTPNFIWKLEIWIAVIRRDREFTVKHTNFLFLENHAIVHAVTLRNRIISVMGLIC